MSEPISVLVAVEEPQRHREVASAVERAGYRVLSAHNSVHAEAQFLQGRPHVALISAYLPPSDGDALCSILRRSLATCYCVLLEESDSQERKRHGANADETLSWEREAKTFAPRLRLWTRIAQAERHAQELRQERDDLRLRLEYNDQERERTTTLLVEMAAQLQAEITRNQELEADRIEGAKSDMVVQAAAALRHEINNPLFAISGSAESLLKRLQAREAQSDQAGETQELRTRAERILKGAERIGNVVQAFSQVITPSTTDYLPGVPMLDLHSEAA